MCQIRSAIQIASRNAQSRAVFCQRSSAHKHQFESVKQKFSHRKKNGAQ